MSTLVVPTQSKTGKAMELISEGRSVQKAAKLLGISKPTFYRLLKDSEDFHRAYIEAKEIWADTMAHKAIKEAYKPLHEDKQLAAAGVQRQRLIISTLQWTAGKLKPRSWGDRVDVDVSGHVTVSPLAQLRQLGAETDQPVIDVEPVTEDDCF
jgi:hypothetical protein